MYILIVDGSMCFLQFSLIAVLDMVSVLINRHLYKGEDKASSVGECMM